MSKVIFSNWAGKKVDNRGLDTDKRASVENLELPMQYDDKKIKAFMSWNGLVVNDEKVNILDMTHSYLTEVQKLSCGECNVGYQGIKVMLNTLKEILKGKGSKEQIALLKSLGNGIKENTKCDFCSQAVTPVLDTLNYYEDEYKKAITNKNSIAKLKYTTRITSPCMEACPAHQDIPGYIELIRNHRYEEALSLISKTNCLPGVLGRTCFAFCENNCVRNDIDSPISIRALKRVPADNKAGDAFDIKPDKKGKGEKVAVIGAGPAGLAASYNLTLMGYKVTVYDDQASAGGMALAGIPAYRLPKDVLKQETDKIKKLGIDFKFNTKVGKNITIDQLYAQGFKAIFIATGAHLGRESDVENWNEEYDGVTEGLDFLRDVNSGKNIAPNKNKVIIIGGGNVAMDCARTCIRLGSKEVTVVYRRSRDEMPGRQEEIEEAEREGVKFHFLALPVKVFNKGNKVTAAECIKMELGEPDDSGRRRPVPVKNSEFTIETDMIISAIGEIPDLSFLTKDKEINVTERGTVEVKEGIYQTTKAGVFSGGDCVVGPATLIEAIAAGNKAAKSIDQYLQTGKVTVTEEDMTENWLHDLALIRQRNDNIVVSEVRKSPEQLDLTDRALNFNEVEQCFTDELATEETERCLRCYRVMLMAVKK
ncbi:FAD-dependent oxidoreductase [Chloroflexota bacterium]